ncbi:MAG: hypothetical protein ABIU20_01475 [Blastocatellia bacterium]
MFRCVYRLSRERWRQDSREGFSADHFTLNLTFASRNLSMMASRFSPAAALNNSFNQSQ